MENAISINSTGVKALRIEGKPLTISIGETVKSCVAQIRQTDDEIGKAMLELTISAAIMISCLITIPLLFDAEPLFPIVLFMMISPIIVTIFYGAGPYINAQKKLAELGSWNFDDVFSEENKDKIEALVPTNRSKKIKREKRSR